jgi:hypothetical protein
MPGWQVLGSLDGPEMLSFWRQDPDAARTHAIDIPFCIILSLVVAAGPSRIKKGGWDGRA